jgi:hypothetical protein
MRRREFLTFIGGDLVPQRVAVIIASALPIFGIAWTVVG